MMSLANNLFQGVTGQNLDKVVGLNAMTAAAGSASAYFSATLQATTPEVRRLFSEYTTQSVIGHETITALCIQKNWIQPYDDPAKQLSVAYQQAQQSVNHQVQ
jgi:spore coat protein CotF